MHWDVLQGAVQVGLAAGLKPANVSAKTTFLPPVTAAEPLLGHSCPHLTQLPLLAAQPARCMQQRGTDWSGLTNCQPLMLLLQQLMQPLHMACASLRLAHVASGWHNLLSS